MAVHNDTKTRLLTLLNVSHLRVSKRKLVSPHSVENIEPPEKRVKLNKPRTSVIPEQDHTLNDSPFALDSNVSESSDDAGDIDNRDDGSGMSFYMLFRSSYQTLTLIHHKTKRMTLVIHFQGISGLLPKFSTQGQGRK